MKKTQTKDTTGKIILSLILLFFGEGLFNFGLYWPILVSLMFVSKRVYWYGFLFGILVSSVTSTPLGLASLLIVSGLFIFDRMRQQIGANFFLIGLVIVGLNLASDKLMGLNWSLMEAAASFGLTWLLFRFSYFSDDLRLSNQ